MPGTKEDKLCKTFLVPMFNSCSRFTATYAPVNEFLFFVT